MLNCYRGHSGKLIFVYLRKLDKSIRTKRLIFRFKFAVVNLTWWVGCILGTRRVTIWHDHTHVCSMFYLKYVGIKNFFFLMSLDKEALSIKVLTFDIEKLGKTKRRPNGCEWFLVESGNL